ncbi:MAG: type II secretion system protein M [Lachnospiraceae bacterium]|nr:type II secretion system protein M [Lachnospiraceae bacterium]
MKIWSRDFTRLEKILLLVLSVILVALVYYQFVDRPVRTSIASARAESQALQTELDAVKIKAKNLERLQNEIDEIKGSGSLSRMESYNNSRAEIALLNDILADTLDYTIEFSDVTRSNEQIRRNFTLKFRTQDYSAMRSVIEQLCSSKERCLVTEMKCQTTRNEKESYVTANVTATFFETMVGGKPDAGLPEDSAQTEQGE